MVCANVDGKLKPHLKTDTNQKHQYGLGIKKTFQKNTPREVDLTIAYLKGLNSKSFDQSLIWYVNKSF